MRRRRVVAIANRKGGTGKTSITGNFAALLAKRFGRRTLVIDLDTQRNSTRHLLGRRDGFGGTIWDFFDPEAKGVTTTLPELILPSPHDPNLFVIPGSKEFDEENETAKVHRVEALPEFAKARFLNDVATWFAEDLPEDFEFVLVDCPPGLGIFARAALIIADGVLLVTQPEVDSLNAVEDVVKLLERLKDPARGFDARARIDGILVNLMDPNTILHRQLRDELKALYGDLVFDAVIPRLMGFPESQAVEPPQPVMMFHDEKAVRATDSMLAFVNEYLTRLEGDVLAYASTGD